MIDIKDVLIKELNGRVYFEVNVNRLRNSKFPARPALLR